MAKEATLNARLGLHDTKNYLLPFRIISFIFWRIASRSAKSVPRVFKLSVLALVPRMKRTVEE
jgi:hypothetical protein